MMTVVAYRDGDALILRVGNRELRTTSTDDAHQLAEAYLETRLLQSSDCEWGLGWLALFRYEKSTSITYMTGANPSEETSRFYYKEKVGTVPNKELEAAIVELLRLAEAIDHSRGLPKFRDRRRNREISAIRKELNDISVEKEQLDNRMFMLIDRLIVLDYKEGIVDDEIG